MNGGSSWGRCIIVFRFLLLRVADLCWECELTQIAVACVMARENGNSCEVSCDCEKECAIESTISIQEVSDQPRCCETM